MKKLVLLEKVKRSNESVYCDEEIADINRIIAVCSEHGYSIEFSEACDVWGEYSSDLFAGWLYLPDSSEELMAVIRNYTC